MKINRKLLKNNKKNQINYYLIIKALWGISELEEQLDMVKTILLREVQIKIIKKLL